MATSKKKEFFSGKGHLIIIWSSFTISIMTNPTFHIKNHMKMARFPTFYMCVFYMDAGSEDEVSPASPKFNPKPLSQLVLVKSNEAEICTGSSRWWSCSITHIPHTHLYLTQVDLNCQSSHFTPYL